MAVLRVFSVEIGTTYIHVWNFKLDIVRLFSQAPIRYSQFSMALLSRHDSIVGLSRRRPLKLACVAAALLSAAWRASCDSCISQPLGNPCKFADNYRSLDEYAVCMVPGHVAQNGFTSGATAICGGSPGGVSIKTLVDSSGNSVGQVRLGLRTLRTHEASLSLPFLTAVAILEGTEWLCILFHVA